jgi:Domain of unknown function (DUF4331)
MKCPRKCFFLTAAATALTTFIAPFALADGNTGAPTADKYASIAIGDLYMFRDPPNCQPGPGCNLVVALTTQAVADPQFGASYHFQENALYKLNFTTRPDARPTDTIQLVFGPFGNNPACASGPRCQQLKATFSNGTVIDGLATQGTSGPTHLPPVINETDLRDVKIFAGPRQNPFFFDLVGFNRAIAAGDPSKYTGVDAYKDKNALAIVVEFPLSWVFPTGCALTPPFSTACGVWAATYLGDFRPDDLQQFEPKPEKLRQIDRVGNPMVSTMLIPGALRDAFNFGKPTNDAQDFAGVIDSQIVALDKKFGTCADPNATTAAGCNPNAAFLESVVVPNILRFAMDAFDGYPNGRLPSDRVTDLLTTLILRLTNFTDGTTTKTYCPGFPFLRPPLQLSGSAPFDYDSNPQACD